MGQALANQRLLHPLLILGGLLHHGVDHSVIALWLGHESAETTKMYLHADMRLKEKALLRTAPIGVKPARYHPDDELLAFLEGL